MRFFAFVLFIALWSCTSPRSTIMKWEKTATTVVASPRPDSLIFSGDSAYFPAFRFYKDPDSDTLLLTYHSSPLKDAQLLMYVDPNWSDKIKQTHLNETTTVKMLVDTLGAIQLAIIEESSDTVLNVPSLNAAMQMRFNPAMWEGKPIRSWVKVNYVVK